MKIAVINETSAADKNKDILAALSDSEHEIINVGMSVCGAQPELTYIHTSLMSALLLNTKRVDFVVGGCGTGQGFLNAVMQYPSVFCGHILSPLDAWLFPQINAGNCISLALNQGYGWAGDINLKFIFTQLFSVEWGCGYPSHRQEPQKQSRELLANISEFTHKPFYQILELLPQEMLKHTLNYPNFKELLDISSIKDEKLKMVLQKF